MADPVTTNRGYAVPTRGSDVGTWDTPINGDFNLIDQNLGAVSTISLSNANVTLISSQYACGTIRLTGALTGGVAVIFPAVQGWWTIDNQTTGAFVATISIGSGQVIAVEQGSAADILIDGTNVKFRNLPPVGTYLDVCDATVPAWITACTIPPYLNCNAGTFSSATYPYLFVKLGTTTLPDFRGRAPYYLNQGTSVLTSSGAGIDGNTRFATGGNNGILLTSLQVPSLTSSGVNNIIVAAGTSLQVNTAGAVSVASGGAGNVPIANGGVGTLSSGNNTITVSYTNPGGSPNPVNNAAPGTVGGIRLIRAA